MDWDSLFFFFLFLNAFKKERLTLHISVKDKIVTCEFLLRVEGWGSEVMVKRKRKDKRQKGFNIKRGTYGNDWLVVMSWSVEVLPTSHSQASESRCCIIATIPCFSHALLVKVRWKLSDVKHNVNER